MSEPSEPSEPRGPSDYDPFLDEIDVAPMAPPRRRVLPLVLLGLAVVVAGIGVAAVVFDGGAGHPDKWDPRVTDLVAFVERERGLEFEHPVRIDFLDSDAFREEVTEHEELDDEEREQLERFEAMFRAVGLFSGDVDLEKIAESLVGEGTIGFYRFEDERIVLRGETLDDQRRSTLVHELTHVLQDQHFDIGDLEPEKSGEEAALTAVVEADAEKVEEQWRGTLSKAARERLEAAEDEDAEDVDFEGVPDVFVELMGFPYIFGPDFLDAVIEAKGAAGRDELFRNRPTTEEHIVQPDTYLAGQAAQDVPTPALEDGEDAVDESEGDFGMLSLLVVLAERVDFGPAWAAVQGWAGDATIAFERDDVVCVRTDVAFDDAEQATRFDAAIDEWGRELRADHRQEGRFVRFESCDPGTEATGGRAEGHVSGIQGLALRREIANEFESGGVPAAPAACLADGLIARLGANRVTELGQILSGNPQDPRAAEIRSTVEALVPSCRQ